MFVVIEIMFFSLLITFSSSQGQLTCQRHDYINAADLLNHVERITKLINNFKAENHKMRQTLLNVDLGCGVKCGEYSYQLSPILTWSQSRQWCKKWGGDLAFAGVKTYAERRSVLQMIFASGDFVWLGGNDINEDDLFYWLDGTSVAILEWASGEPNNGGGPQNCLSVYLDYNERQRYELDDGTCGYKFPGLCEKKV